MFSRTLARVKDIGGLILISAVLAACGGEGTSDAVPASNVQAPDVSQKLSSAISSTAASITQVQVPDIPKNSSSSKSSTALVTPRPSSIASSVSVAASSATIISTPTSKVNSSLMSTTLSSKAASSIPLSSKAASSISLSSKAASSRALSSKAASSMPAGTLGAIIGWRQPDARENGAYLELSEIGGYQIRYKTPTATAYNYITIEGNTTTDYEFNKSIIGLKFEIAVYDSNGLYSDFVVIN